MVWVCEGKYLLVSGFDRYLTWVFLLFKCHMEGKINKYMCVCVCVSNPAGKQSAILFPLKTVQIKPLLNLKAS